MENSFKRPKRIWLIFIWFLFGGLSSIYTALNLSTGHASVPTGLDSNIDWLFYVQAIGLPVFTAIAATCLFLRMAVNRWLFAIVLVLSALSFVHSFFFKSIPDEYLVATVITMLITLCLYSLITKYSFGLLKGNYYKNT